MPIYDPLIAATPLASKIEMARETERVARAYDPRINLVERAGYEDAEYLSLIMNSKGLQAMAKGNSTALYISLVAQDENDSQNGFSVMARRKIADLSPAASRTGGGQSSHTQPASQKHPIRDTCPVLWNLM